MSKPALSTEDLELVTYMHESTYQPKQRRTTTCTYNNDMGVTGIQWIKCIAVYIYIYLCYPTLIDLHFNPSTLSIYRLQTHLFRNSICFLSDLLAAQSHLEIHNVSAKWIPLRSWKNTPTFPVLPKERLQNCSFCQFSHPFHTFKTFHTLWMYCQWGQWIFRKLRGARDFGFEHKDVLPWEGLTVFWDVRLQVRLQRCQMLPNGAKYKNLLNLLEQTFFLSD